MLLHHFPRYYLPSVQTLASTSFFNFTNSHSPFQNQRFITYFIPPPNSPSFYFIFFFLFPFNPFYPPSFLPPSSPPPPLNICPVWNCHTFLLMCPQLRFWSSPLLEPVLPTLSLLSYPENGCSMFVWKTDTYLQNCMASCHRRRQYVCIVTSIKTSNSREICFTIIC
jgi:hypothetical protein